MDELKKVNLRPLRLSDLDAVRAIDYSLFGKNRLEYWEKKLRKAETSGVPSLAAEIDGRIIGFILGSATGSEYHIPQYVGWIDTVIIAREWQYKGVSELLVRWIGKI
jgi:predicted N-acetyltransferase YhbS